VTRKKTTPARSGFFMSLMDQLSGLLQDPAYVANLNFADEFMTIRKDVSECLFTSPGWLRPKTPQPGVLELGLGQYYDPVQYSGSDCPSTKTHQVFYFVKNPPPELIHLNGNVLCAYVSCGFKLTASAMSDIIARVHLDDLAALADGVSFVDPLGLIPTRNVRATIIVLEADTPARAASLNCNATGTHQPCFTCVVLYIC
jgi:hypothetical protein